MPPHHHAPYVADDTIRPWLRVVSISVRDIIMVILTIGLSLANETKRLLDERSFASHGACRAGVVRRFRDGCGL